jgi:dipeptidyl aminopeptidase/acylaminoacyl peptidase
VTPGALPPGYAALDPLPPGTAAAVCRADAADDVRAALDWLRRRAAERGDVDPRRLALLGHSEGGVIAPIVADDDPGVAALVLLAAPAYTGRRVSIAQQRDAIAARMPGASAAARDTAFRRNLARADSAAAAVPWLRFWWAYDPLPTARRVRAPVLILQGATDRQVTPEQADTLAAAFRAGGNQAVTVRVFPATDHLLLADPSGAPAGYTALPSRAVRPEVLGAVADWVAARLAPARPAR